jgi:hypothetical protein
MSQTVAELLVGVLEQIGVKHIFGLIDDQIVPIADCAMLSAKLVKDAKLKVCKGGSHRICTTEKDNADLLEFIKA